jgi:hypothetical protein
MYPTKRNERHVKQRRNGCDQKRKKRTGDVRNESKSASGNGRRLKPSVRPKLQRRPLKPSESEKPARQRRKSAKLMS